jgi:hypothetical protein
MSEILFPERQRCKKCRKGFDKVVLDGLFCSYRCAGLKSPSTRLVDAPRGCKREVSGRWDWKTKFRADSEVPQRLRDDPATNVYWCDFCHFKHVGHSRVQVEDFEKLRRLVGDAVTLGSVILRAREARGLSRKQLAGLLKLPMVRLKEIEEGDPKASLVNTLAVLSRLRIAVELIER